VETSYNTSKHRRTAFFLTNLLTSSLHLFPTPLLFFFRLLIFLSDFLSIYVAFNISSFLKFSLFLSISFWYRQRILLIFTSSCLSEAAGLCSHRTQPLDIDATEINKPTYNKSVKHPSSTFTCAVVSVKDALWCVQRLDFLFTQQWL